MQIPELRAACKDGSLTIFCVADYGAVACRRHELPRSKKSRQRLAPTKKETILAISNASGSRWRGFTTKSDIKAHRLSRHPTEDPVVLLRPWTPESTSRGLDHICLVTIEPSVRQMALHLVVSLSDT
jgi:hypothetical protein